MKKLLLLALFTALFNLAGFSHEDPSAPKAKTRVMLTGKVTDHASNEMLAGVKISCNACSKTFYSDLDGRFFICLETDSPETLKLEFSQIGYSSKSLDAKELQGNDSSLDIDLDSE